MRFPLLAAAALALTAAQAAAAPAVVTDFAPTQSITERLMQGVATPVQILPPGAEPHSYSLRPSEARALSDADLVIWIGPRMTPWLADPITTLATGATVLTLDTLPGLTLLPVRDSGPFETHAHDEAAHDEHDDEHAHEAGHTETEPDPAIDQHLWLDPDNAIVFAAAIAAELATLDPANAAAYRANAAAFATDTRALTATITAELAPVREKPYFVFHDAYQYFENRFDIPASGSVAVHDAEEPGAARVAAIRDRIRADGVTCAFSEPQFPPKLLATLTEGTEARTAPLDPEGTALTPGIGLYPALLEGLASGLVNCLDR